MSFRIFSDARFSENALKVLKEGLAGHALVFPARLGDSLLSAAQADPAMADAEIAFGQPPIEGILNARGLRWVQVTSAGYTRYDTAEFRAAAEARGLIVTNSSSVFAEACAEHALAFMLAQARQLPECLRTRCANGSADWSRLRNASGSLRGQEVVIVGFGAIGIRLAELLAPFGMKVTAMRRQPRGDEGIATVTPEKLHQALATADHVVNILPENGESLGFFTAERLGQMKRGAIFYNIGRGTTVDQLALSAALHAEHLGAAWLDVTDPEPLPDGHPLWTAPHCHITPHTAGGFGNESDALVRHFLANLKRFSGEMPLLDRIF